MSNDTKSNVSVVLKYYLYRAVGNPGFILPIYTLYLLANGLSFTEIGVIGTIQALIVVGGEIPTGYVGDRIGRRNSLLVAQVLFAGSNVGMILATDFVGFTVAFSTLSFANTFVSGSANAWLYDVLQERLDEDRYTYVQGRGSAVGQWVMAATMIAGSLLYVSDHVYPFYAALVMNGVSFLVVSSLPQTAYYAGTDDDSGVGDADDGDEHLTILDTWPIIRKQLSEPPLRPFVVYMALFFGVTTTVGAYVQPIAVDALEASAGAYLASLGVPEAASLGVLYASFTVVSAIASDRASDLEAALGVRGALLIVPFVAAAAYVVPAFVAVAAFPMFFVMRGTRSLLGPIVNQYLNDHIESVGRATVLSAVSMVYALARIPFALGSGLVADWFTPMVGVAALGATFAVVGAAMQFWRPPVAHREAESAGASAASD